MDSRPQLERTLARALWGSLFAVVGGALLGGGLSAAAIVWLTTKPKESS